MGATGRRLCVALIGVLALARLAVCSEVWLYTLVAADYDGASLMPHFLEHYHDLKLAYNRMLVNVHHNPAKYDRAALDMILGVCASYRIYCRIWEGPFSSEAHYNRTLGLLKQFVHDPDDWVVLADSDEFQDYGGRSIPDFLNRTEAGGGSYVTGTLVDRLAPEGRLAPIAPAPSMARQFPLACKVVKKLYKGWDFKVVAHKNYLRAGRANHIIVRPDKAAAYFGPCSPGAKCPRGRNINLEEDWLDLTPYAKFQHKYRYKSSPAGAQGLWDAVEAPTQITINHYKWHAGVLPSMRDRAEYYSGDCVLGANEGSCTPLLLHWRESAKTYAAIKDSHQLDLAGMSCQPATDSPEALRQPVSLRPAAVIRSAGAGSSSSASESGAGSAATEAAAGAVVAGAGLVEQQAGRDGGAAAHWPGAGGRRVPGGGLWSLAEAVAAAAASMAGQRVAEAEADRDSDIYVKEPEPEGEEDFAAEEGGSSGSGGVEAVQQAAVQAVAAGGLAGAAAGLPEDSAGAEGGEASEEEGEGGAEDETGHEENLVAAAEAEAQAAAEQLAAGGGVAGGAAGSGFAAVGSGFAAVGDLPAAAAAAEGSDGEPASALQLAVEDTVERAGAGGSSGSEGKKKKNKSKKRAESEADRAQAEVHAAVHGAVQALLQDEFKADAARKAALVESDYQAAGAGAAGEQEGESAAAA